MDLFTANQYLTFVETTAPALQGLASKAAFKEFSAQEEKFRSAFDYFLTNGHVDESFRFASVLISYWMRTKRLEEGLATIEKCLAQPGGSDALRGRANFDAGYLHFWKGDYERAIELHTEALRLGKAAKNPTVTAMALTGLARVYLGSDLEKARRYCLEGLDVTNGTSDELGRSNVIHVLGVIAQMTGDFIEARSLMNRRITLARRMGDYAVVSSEGGNLSMVERQLGNLDDAEALARQALEIDYQRGDELAIPWKVNGLVAVAVDRGHYEQAAILLGIADNAMRISGGQWPPDELIHYEHSVDVLLKEMGPDEFEKARAVGSSMPMAEAMEFAMSPYVVGVSIY